MSIRDFILKLRTKREDGLAEVDMFWEKQSLACYEHCKKEGSKIDGDKYWASKRGFQAGAEWAFNYMKKRKG